MNKLIKLNLLIFSILFFSSMSSSVYSAVPEKTPDVLILKNGSQIIGEIKNEDSDTVIIFVDSITMSIPRNKIKQIIYSENVLKEAENTEKSKEEPLTPEVPKPVTKMNEIKEPEPEKPLKDDKKEHVWFSNPNDTRYFFAPTAMMLKQGKGYVQDIYVFLGSANYGITDNFSIGGMFSFIPFIPLNSQFFGITPKLGYEINENLNIAAGLLASAGPSLNSNSSVPSLGMLYGLATYGSRDNNISLGLGYGFQQINSFSQNYFLMLGGMYRITEYISLITENWLFSVGTPIIIPSAGLRFFGENISVDFALTAPSFGLGFIPGFPVIPYVDFVINF